MGQNTSSAVMAQRREPKDSLDDFPTPPWGTRALLEFLVNICAVDPNMTVREPAANRGHMVKALQEFFIPPIIASDVADYGAGFPVEDYLFPGDPTPIVDWTITNPPFRLAEEFIHKATRRSRHGCAMLVRTSFIEGVGRHTRIFSYIPPDYVLQFTERLVMHQGKLSKDGSTATSYCWLIWHRCEGDTRLRWTGVCRDRLERPGDYDTPDMENQS